MYDARNASDEAISLDGVYIEDAVEGYKTLSVSAVSPWSIAFPMKTVLLGWMVWNTTENAKQAAPLSYAINSKPIQLVTL
ncbi:hypothetical protein [Eubacterium limosum]|uniref:hypothetical protein n=1 Tax=Eubacterium limosum TaxID=1736 RepID=UPI001FA8FAC3|nr:hypothetical protein [Eubacterium limosum]